MSFEPIIHGVLDNIEVPFRNFFLFCFKFYRNIFLNQNWK